MKIRQNLRRFFHLNFFTANGPMLLVGLFAAGSLNAADSVWIGGTGLWNTPGDWSTGSVPGPGDNAFITNSGTYTVTVDTVNQTVASLTLGGPSGNQVVSIVRAILTLNGTSLVNANGQLSLTIANSTVAGTGNLTVIGVLDWANGAMSGTGATTIGPGGTLSIGSGGVNLSRPLNNGGIGTWSGGNFTFNTGAALNNLPGGTFDITADGHVNGTAATPINNAGLLRLTAGTAGTVVTAPVTNSGTLAVLSSTLNLNLGGNHSGTFSNAPGATLVLGGGNHSLTASSLVTGGGVFSVGGNATTLNASGTFDVSGTTLTVTAGTVTLASGCVVTGTTLNLQGNGAVVVFNSAGSVAAVNLGGGTLGGSSPIIVTGLLTLGGGTVTNLLVNADGGLSINGNVTLSGCKLVNPGAAVWSAGNLVGANGAVVSNLFSGTITNTFDGNATRGSGAAPLFINAGAFRKTGATAALGATSIDFQFVNTGVVEVQTNTLRYSTNQQNAGLTLLDGGGLSAQGVPLQFSGGSLVGTGAVTVANTVNVVNSATFSPGLPLGRMDITGNYQQTSTGSLDIELGGYVPGVDFDLITVTAGGAGGSATLNGTLNVSLINGFSPTNGATFTFLTAGSRAGGFTAFNYPSNDIGMQITMDATSAAIKVTNLKPVVANPIAAPAAITYGAAFNFQFPANTFTDPDNDVLTYTSSGMPAGITFAGATRTFSGTPTQAGVFPVAVIANDGGTPNLKATNIFNITILPAALTVTADSLVKTYGGADPALTYAVTGLVAGDTAGVVLSGALTRAAGESVAGGPYAITQGTLAANSNYTLTFVPGTLTISKAPLSVTADAKSKFYGAADPGFTVGYLGFVNGETLTVLGGTLGFARAPGENVGGYAITPGGLTSGNYAIAFNSGTLTINKAALSVTAEAKSKTYGAADPAFTVTYAGFVNSETAAVLGGTLSFSRAPGENVGGYLITPGGLTSGNYSITFNTGTLTITKAALSVTAEAKSKTYGLADPAFTVTYSGFVNSETAAVLGGTLTFSRAPGENVGGYLITPSGLTSGNYAITFNTGTLTINKAALSVTADGKTKTYGSIDPAFTVTYAGFVNSETAAVLTGTLAFSRAPGENVGGYLITPSGLTSGNYTITFDTGTLTILQAPLSVTADAKSKTYGSADPGFTATFLGFVNGDTAAALGGTLSFSRAPGENVGGYLITPSGLTSGNYTITFNTGTLTINKAALSVTADAKTKTYGSIDPAFTASFAGFVNGETASVLVGTLTFSRVSGENVGGYLITPSGLTSSNYAITFSSGTLTISRAALSVTADSKTKSYGAADPLFTASFLGFVNGETAAVLGGALTISRAPGENAGDYLITPSGLTSGNYAITFNTGTLTITKVALSVTADAKSKTYGATDPAFTASYSGFVNGETAAVLGGTLTFSRAPGENVGGYLITPGGLTSGNYTITYNTGTLTITKAALSVTADAKTKTYGAADPAFTVTYSGFVNSETAAVLGGTLTFTRAPGEAVGGYLLTPSGLTSGNYAITFNTGTLTINKAALAVTADAKSKTYGSVDPAFTATFVGFVNGETTAVLAGTLTFSRNSGENVGGYLITPSGLTSGNYALTFNPGTLTINKAALSVTADAKSKLYGAADPAFTASFSGFVNSETPAVLGGTLTFSRAPGENVGGYLITPSGLTSGNYAITFNTGTLTINKAALSVTADAKTKTYGAADPAFTASYAGFVNNETPSVLGGTLTFSRAPGENVGTYLITPSGLTSGNYALTFNTGTLSITAPAPLLLPLTFTGTTGVVISWSAVTNGTYRVQFKSDLKSTTWTDIPGDVTANATVASKTDLRTPTNRWYRVQVVP